MTSMYIFIIRILDIVFSIITLLLGLRIVLRLLAVNPQAPFVAWIYGVNDRFIAPFRGIFPNVGVNNGQLFDISAIVAVITYAILYYLIKALIGAVTHSADTYYIENPNAHAHE